MNKELLQPIRPLLIVFLLLNALALAGKSFLLKQGISQDLLIIGNLLLFVVSFAAYRITYRSLQSTNPQAFVRAMYGGFMIKFFLIAIAAFIYIMARKNDVNKPGLGILAALYILYTFVEIKALLKLLKLKKNG
jgi:uncharacterized BrkB/YihY/UPF0761 family membrane protein